MKNETLKITAYDGVDTAVFAKTLGEWISKSGLFGCSNLEQGNILAVQCIAEKKTPLELSRLYHIIGGRLSLRADAMLGLFRERGGKVKWTTFTADAAVAIFTLDGVETEISYTRADATLALLLPARAGSQWARYPAEMLRARMISKAIRMVAPEVCAGVYTPEEVADFAPQPPPEKRATVEVVPQKTENQKQNP